MYNNKEKESSKSATPQASNSLMTADPFFADLDHFHQSFFERTDRMLGGMMDRFFGEGSAPLSLSRWPEHHLTDMKPFKSFDDVLNGFNQIDQNEFNQPLPKGNCISQTYVSSTKMGPDGKPHKEEYFKNSVNGLSECGHRIGQVEEKYHNTGNGLKKTAQQKLLNDQAYKMVRSKTGDEPEEQLEFFHGMNDSQRDEFNNRWEDESRKVKLDKMISAARSQQQRMIGRGREPAISHHREQPLPIHQQHQSNHPSVHASQQNDQHQTTNNNTWNGSNTYQAHSNSRNYK